jgi:hypothetical protein
MLLVTLNKISINTAMVGTRTDWEFKATAEKQFTDFDIDKTTGAGRIDDPSPIYGEIRLVNNKSNCVFKGFRSGLETCNVVKSPEDLL